MGKVRNERRRERKHREISCSRAECAKLVRFVYLRDQHKLGRLATSLRYHNRRAESYGKEHWELMDCTPFGTDEAQLERLGLAFFLSKEPYPNTRAPRLAIILRGTCKLGDLFVDLKIAMGLLAEDERFLKCQDLIGKVIQYYKNAYGGSDEMICMAGHSLGAAIAGEVGSKLHTRQISIDTHLFNPPMLTFDSILRCKFLPGKSTPIANNLQRRKLLRVGASLQLALLNVLKPRALCKEWNEFVGLQDWIPHFYLNPRDLICLQYLKYFRKWHGKATLAKVMDPQVVINFLCGQQGKYLRTVVPSADLHISHKFKHNLLRAHSLDQWQHTDTDIKLENEQARLLTGTRHFAHEMYDIGSRFAHKAHNIAHKTHSIAHKVHKVGSTVKSIYRWASE